MSSAVEGAEIVASIVMPELLRRGICHARRKGLIHPGPRAPCSRPHHPVFVEMPLDEGHFIYGEAMVDPVDQAGGRRHDWGRLRHSTLRHTPPLSATTRTVRVQPARRAGASAFSPAHGPSDGAAVPQGAC